MNYYKPVFTKADEMEREKLTRIIDKHLVELKAAFDEYLSSNDQRAEEMERFLCEDSDSKKRLVYYASKRCLQIAYPEPPKISHTVKKVYGVPIVKSVNEAKKKGLTCYAIVEEGPHFDVPEEWKDDIEWIGSSVSVVIPSPTDRNNPARMTEDGTVYYR